MTVDSVTIDSLNEIIDLLCNELILLVAWKKSEKIKPVKQNSKTWQKPVFE